MERNFTDENFERILRENADELRMKPSEKVWRGITRHLNKRKRRVGFGLAFLMLTLAGGSYLYLEYASANQQSFQNPLQNTQSKKAGIVIQNTPVELISQFDVPTATRNANAPSVGDAANDARVKNIRTGFILPGYNAPSLLKKPTATLINTTEENFNGSEFISPVIDSHYDENYTAEKAIPDVAKTSESQYPLTIESVTNLYNPKLNRKKLSFQLFFTPTISYRRLSENKEYINSVAQTNVPFNQQSLYNINTAVTHKPAFGFEVGMAAKYEVDKNVKLRAGLQFNMNRYDIKTFHSSFQYGTIRFNNFDTVSQVTNYNNFNGYKSNWLENFYFQVSAPVGVEVMVSGNDKTSFGVATTLQPTYILGDRAYLLSTDYKNYMEVPWLIRKWNINTSLEAFVTYSTGKLEWQVGPQVRYQLLSSFVKKYPVKENLFDFGLKVGVSLDKK